MLRKVKKHIITSIIFGAVLYLGLSVYADYQSVINSFSAFSLLLLPVLLLLSYLNYFTRFLKWHYYLRVLKIKTSFKDSFLIFMSGLIMSVTPGKFGELLKSYMLKKVSDEPISKTAPIILVERITDFLSLLLIAVIGSYIYGTGEEIVVGTSIFFILLVFFLSNKSLSAKTFNLLYKIKFVKKLIPGLEEAFQSSFEMLRIKPLILMFIVSFVSWFFECLGFYLVLNNFDSTVSLFWASFTYAFATILGSITMLPGGLGVTDGSLTFILVQKGFSADISVTATFIIRVVTLWFAIFVGIISVLLYQRRFGNIEAPQ